MKLTQITNVILTEDPDDTGYSSTTEMKAHLLPYLQHEIGKLNKKAQKLGTPPVTINVINTFYKDVKGSDTKEKYIEVEVVGEAPRIPGYDFLATIEHKEAGNIIRTVPGVSEPNIKNFYEAKPDYCDHCKKVRKRIDTFIIREQKTGELRQIGRNCLSDFLGGRDPKAILFWISIRDSIEEIFNNADSYEGKHQGRAEYSASPGRILDIAGALVKEFGYRKSIEDDSTPSIIRKILFYGFGDGRYAQEEKKQYDEVLEKNKDSGKELAKQAKDWFDTISDDEKENNNFYHSIDVLLKSKDVSPRDVGFLAALIPAYQRAAGELESKKSKSNEWVGTPGDKIPKTKIKVTNTTYMQNRFAYNAPDTQVVKMEDDDGNSYTWFNSSSKELEEGESYYIIGTIKKHDEYRGRKSTVLTRVKSQLVD